MLQVNVKEFGEAIRQSRLAAGKTLQKVASEAGVSTSYVGRVERGSLPTPPSDAAIQAMCSALGLDPSPFLEMRKSFYRAGPMRQLSSGNVVEMVLPDIAALGEQAFKAAQEQSRRTNIEAAMQLAEIALSHLESSRRHGSVARTGHLLASLCLEKIQEGGAVDVTECRLHSLGYYEIAFSAFRRIANPTIDDQLKLNDCIAQFARQLEALSCAPDDNYIPLTLVDFDKWPVAVSLAASAIDRKNLVSSFERSFPYAFTDGSFEESRTDAQILSGLMANHLAKAYANALLLVAESRNRELLAQLRKLPETADNLVMTAMAATNLAGVLIDYGRLTSDLIPDEPIRIVEELALQLKLFMASAISTDRKQVSRRLQKCHQELGAWYGSRDQVKEAAWNLFVALKLDPDDLLEKTAYIRNLVELLSHGRAEVVEQFWKWLEENVADEQFQALTYPIRPPDEMPN